MTILQRAIELYTEANKHNVTAVAWYGLGPNEKAVYLSKAETEHNERFKRGLKPSETHAHFARPDWNNDSAFPLEEVNVAKPGDVGVFVDTQGKTRYLNTEGEPVEFAEVPVPSETMFVPFVVKDAQGVNLYLDPEVRGVWQLVENKIVYDYDAVLLAGTEGWRLAAVVNADREIGQPALFYLTR